jgi:3-(3-hydroxy-phenyl)propionate hydroxylase
MSDQAADVSREDRPVLVVGAGPVGLTAANLLAERGVPVVVVERNATTSDQAKAISLDDESLRTMQAAGLAEQILRVVVPGTGTRYFDRHGKALFQARGPEPYRAGYAFKSQFAQPELEAVLADALRARPNVELRFDTALVDFANKPGGVAVRLRDGASGEERTETYSWVLGCDGGRSSVRELAGIGMTGISHDELWLVADTLGDPHRERYGLHRGTPERPTVIVPGRNGRCRYEFRLEPGEAAVGEAPFELIERLVAPYRTITPEQVERATTYTFNAVVADTWRAGRCFLLGDAAHMMPPFAGQGLNSGVRDAANLSWKLALVWRGAADQTLLDSYEIERKPHSAATVAFSQRLGDVVMTTDRRRAFVRDAFVRTLLAVPAGRRYLEEMRYRPLPCFTEGFLAGCAHPLRGRPLPQPNVLTDGLQSMRLDDALGEGLALLGVGVTEHDWAQVPDSWAVSRFDILLADLLPSPGERPALADLGGTLERALGSASGRFVLVRPDRYVAAVVAPAQVAAIGGLLSVNGVRPVAAVPQEAPASLASPGLTAGATSIPA